MVSPVRGHFVDFFIIADLLKQYFNMGRRPPLYFWRDNNGYIEVDCLAHIGNHLIPFEAKAGETANKDFFDGLKKWNELAQTDPAKGYVVYGGSYTQGTQNGKLLGWKDSGNIMVELDKRISEDLE